MCRRNLSKTVGPVRVHFWTKSTHSPFREYFVWSLIFWENLVGDWMGEGGLAKVNTSNKVCKYLRQLHECNINEHKLRQKVLKFLDQAYITVFFIFFKSINEPNQTK